MSTHVVLRCSQNAICTRLNALGRVLINLGGLQSRPPTTEKKRRLMFLESFLRSCDVAHLVRVETDTLQAESVQGGLQKHSDSDSRRTVRGQRQENSGPTNRVWVRSCRFLSGQRCQALLRDGNGTGIDVATDKPPAQPHRSGCRGARTDEGIYYEVARVS